MQDILTIAKKRVARLYDQPPHDLTVTKVYTDDQFAYVIIKPKNINVAVKVSLKDSDEESIYFFEPRVGLYDSINGFIDLELN